VSSFLLGTYCQTFLIRISTTQLILSSLWCRTLNFFKNFILLVERYTPFSVNKISNISFLFPGGIIPREPDLWQANRAWVTHHPPMHHPKNHVLGFHGWDETVPQGSVYLVSSFFFGTFFFSCFLFFFSRSLFFLPGLTFDFFFSSHNPWTQFCFWELQPTYLPSTTWPIYLLHSTHPSFVLPTITKAWEPGRASLVEFKV